MENIDLLHKELSFYGFRVKDGFSCSFFNVQGEIKTQGIIKTIRQINVNIKEQKNILNQIWKEVKDILNTECQEKDLREETLENVFIFSLKDMSRFLLCFDGIKSEDYFISIENALSKDIVNFSRKQMSQIIDYKIVIDWTYKLICRYKYISSLLLHSASGRPEVNKYKVAAGIAGPWANSDLPMLERAWPYKDEEDNLRGRERDKQNQKRYRMGYDAYNNDERWSEGYVWREQNNEPYLWSERATESPYKSTYLGGK